ncbi:MAG: VOC family protein, partial [Pseudomonadota bacterium]
MKLLRAATLTVADVDATAERYQRWLEYTLVESGTVDADLAARWDAPATAGRAYRVLRPASGTPIYLRLVQGDIPEAYRPLRSYGWAAIEICVQDVLAVARRMENSPFEIIGPPREIPGLDAIYPMQVRGPDGEIAYFTQIRSDLPAFDLPRAGAAIDHLFILVMACSDLPASLRWMVSHTGLAIGREAMEIEYTMLANAFGLPLDGLHTIATMVHERDVFLELDQYPDAAETRPCTPGQLPPAVSIGTMAAPDIDTLYAARTDEWISPPAPHDSVLYGGRKMGTLRDPDGALIELVAC